MIVHIVLMRFDDTAHAEQSVRLARQLADQIPVIRRLVASTTAVRTANSYDVGLVVELDSRDDLEAYHHHPAHEAAATYFREHRSAVSSIDLVDGDD